MTRHSPLYEAYRDYPGIKLIDFAGWELPLNYEAGILAEHRCVRERVGLFDVSHMGELLLSGSRAVEYVDWLVTNAIASLEPGHAAYTPMCYPSGGVVDDLLVYRLGAERLMLVVNAANTEKVLRWITAESPWVASHPGVVGSTAGVLVEDRTSAVALLALQGPAAAGLLGPATGGRIDELAPFEFLEGVGIAGATALISRTGYTGEDGFELYVDAGDAIAVWSGLIERGADAGLLPCGLGARDTLRIEARLPLYGQEISEEISPLEGGLKPFVKLEKEDFCGREALLAMQESGIPRSLRGIRMIDRGVPRSGYPVFAEDHQIGEVTSGGKSPMLDAFIALVLVEAGTLKRGKTVEVGFGEKRKRAEVVRTPFYKNTGGKQ